MRTLITSLALLGPSTLALALACADTDSSCEDTLSCPTTSSGGTGGSGGGLGSVGGASGGDAGGTGGASGAAGTESSVGGAGGSSGAGVGGSAGEGAGGSGVSGAGGTSDGCDGELLPGDDACVVDDQYGVFVSPEGDDGEGEGTREAPFRTLQRAADAAWEADKRVYACATGGAYVERLELGADHDGLELYGSFDCEDWSYDSQLRASVAPESGMALTVSSIANSLRIMGFGFESADATEAGGSSIAVFIEGSEGVVLESTRLSAGAGAKGADGETQEVVFPPKSELDGNPGTPTDGAEKVVVECPAGGTTEGGAGGDTDPTGGGGGLPSHGVPGGEAGVANSACTGLNAMGSGFPGADAPPAADGPGASTAGTLSSSGWTPADGSPGEPGLPGQGGGGGAGAATGGGGSGGAGGCGGAGGAQGRGGGASLALLLLDSQVSIVDSALVSDDAGDGGAGDAGQQGQQERGSFGNGDPDGCPGGSGGLGGNGGHGGGGAGGISAAIAYQGTAPTLSNSDTTAGGAGAGGEGAGADNDGVEGAAEALLEIIPL